MGTSRREQNDAYDKDAYGQTAAEAEAAKAATGDDAPDPAKKTTKKTGKG